MPNPITESLIASFNRYAADTAKLSAVLSAEEKRLIAVEGQRAKEAKLRAAAYSLRRRLRQR